MGTQLKQLADGSVGFNSDLEGIDVGRAGGPKATQNTPNYRPGAVLKLAVAGTADTAGALMSWQNNLGYDIIVYAFMLDVTTQSSGACTVSIGQTATNGTTLSSNILSGKTVAAAGTFPNAATIAVKVPANTWLTGSTASGASAGLVGAAYFDYCPA